MASGRAGRGRLQWPRLRWARGRRHKGDLGQRTGQEREERGRSVLCDPTLIFVLSFVIFMLVSSVISLKLGRPTFLGCG
jgi:hypothetical protein